MTIAQSYEFNIVENGSKWFKSRIFELILRYKPEIIQTFFPEFQVINLSSLLNSHIEPYMGKLPRGKLLALPSDVIRHVQGVERGTFGFGEAIPCPFASFLCGIEIDILDKLYPIHGHPVFDLIGFRAEPEESYSLTIDLKACYQYVNRPIWRVGEDAATFIRRRHELGKQYQIALRKLIQEVEEKLGSS
ncbi:MAG: hypothetical protein ABIM44_08220, partial [candidate division WOR-3 bacterium]